MVRTQVGQVVMTQTQSTFDRQVITRLGRLGRRLRGYALVCGVTWVLTIAFIAAAVQLLLDYNLRLPRDMRAVLLAVILLGLLAAIWRRVFQPLRLQYGPREMACLIEHRHPELRSVLVSAVQFATGRVGAAEFNSPSMIQSVITRAGRQASAITFTEVLNHAQPRRSAILVVIMIVATATAFRTQPEVMGMWFSRNVLLSDEQWPKRTTLIVDITGGVLTGARGDDLEIRARAEGVVPRDVDIIFESESGARGRETMVSVGDRGFRHTFVRVEEPFRFRIKGGDDETEWFEARLSDRPRVEEMTISVTPPAYTRMTPYTLPPERRAVEMLLGSRMTVDIKLNKPVVRAELIVGQEVIAQPTGSQTQWSVSLHPTDKEKWNYTTRTYHFALQDELGLENKRPVRMSIRIVKDDPPRVRMKIVGAGEMITPIAVLPLEFAFTDVYGLAAAEVVYQLSRQGESLDVLPLADFKTDMTKFDTAINWPLQSLSLTPGDSLTVYARATDFNDVTGPGEGISAAAAFRVVTEDELLAELARREQEYRQDFERAIEQQEQLRGRLLTLIRQMDDPNVAAAISNRVAPFERRQRQIAGQVNLIRQQFEQILTEMAVNGLATTTVNQRLGNGVVAPLTRLAKRDLVAAADALRTFGRDSGTKTANTADAAQNAALHEMRLILARMLKWEGFQEVVTMLREILRLQGELNVETRQELERRAADILGGG